MNDVTALTLILRTGYLVNALTHIKGRTYRMSKRLYDIQSLA